MDAEPSFLQIIGRLQAGDDAAAGEVVARFSHRLAGLARRHLDGQLRQKVDAEDVLQSVFKSFFVRHAEGQYEPTGWDSLWALLSVMAVRKCNKQVKIYRTDRRDIGRESPHVDGSIVGSELFDREPTPDEAGAVADTVELLMRGLDERGREVLTLRLQGRQVAEIAADVGCAERTVRRVLERVRERMLQMDEWSNMTPDYA